jgi:hypothetical protein
MNCHKGKRILGKPLKEWIDQILLYWKSCPWAYIIKHYAMKTYGGVDV